MCVFLFVSDIGFNTSIFGNDYVAQLFSNTWFSGETGNVFTSCSTVKL